MVSPLSVIKIVKYIVASGEGGGIAGRQNPTKDNGAPSLCPGASPGFGRGGAMRVVWGVRGHAPPRNFF